MTHWTPGQPGGTSSTGAWGRGSALSERQAWGRCTGREWGPGATLVPELSPTQRSPQRPPLSDGGLRTFTPHRAQLAVLPGWLSEPGHRREASHQQSACEGQRPPWTRPLQSQTEARFPPHCPRGDSSRKGQVWTDQERKPQVGRNGTGRFCVLTRGRGPAAHRPQPPPPPSTPS